MKPFATKLGNDIVTILGSIATTLQILNSNADNTNNKINTLNSIIVFLVTQIKMLAMEVSIAAGGPFPILYAAIKNIGTIKLVRHF